MNNFLIGKLGSINQNLPSVILIKIIIAIALAFIIYRLYVITRRRTSSQIQYAILLSAPIVCTILMSIGSSIPRAFGLFAALSIIRYRAPIKDTKDMSFIFLSVAMGIAIGAGAFAVALIAVILFSLYIFLIEKYLIHKKISFLGVNIVTTDQDLTLKLETFALDKEISFKKMDGKFFLFFRMLNQTQSIEELKKILNTTQSIETYDIEKDYLHNDL